MASIRQNIEIYSSVFLNCSFRIHRLGTHGLQIE